MKRTKKVIGLIVALILCAGLLAACGGKKLSVTTVPGVGIENIILSNATPSNGGSCDVRVNLKYGYTTDSLIVKANDDTLQSVETSGQEVKFLIENITQNIVVSASAQNIHEVELNVDDYTNGLLSSNKIEILDSENNKITFSNKKGKFNAALDSLSAVTVKYKDAAIDTMSIMGKQDNDKIMPVTRAKYLHSARLVDNEKVFYFKINYNDNDELSASLTKYVPGEGEEDKRTYVEILSINNAFYSFIDGVTVAYGDSHEVTVYASDTPDIYIKPATSLVYTLVDPVDITVTAFNEDRNRLTFELDNPLYGDLEVLVVVPTEYDYSVSLNVDESFSGSYLATEAHILKQKVTDAMDTKTSGAKCIDLISGQKRVYLSGLDLYITGEDIGYEIAGLELQIITDYDVEPVLKNDNLNIVKKEMRDVYGRIRWIFEITPKNGTLERDVTIEIEKKSSVRKSNVNLGSDKFYQQSSTGETESNIKIDLTYAIVNKTAAYSGELIFAALPLSGITLSADEILILRVTNAKNGHARLSLGNGVPFHKDIIENPADDAIYLTISDVIADTLNFYVVTAN